MTKQSEILDELLSVSDRLISLAKEMPKKNKNPFRKNYKRGRSRQDKKKRALILFQIHTNTAMSAARIALIKSTPIPKFKEGALF